jgi:hypothetical protein
LTSTGKTGSLTGTVDGKAEKGYGIGRIAEQSTFEGPANIAEPGVDEGNIAAVDATVEDDTCIS